MPKLAKAARHRESETTSNSRTRQDFGGIETDLTGPTEGLRTLNLTNGHEDNRAVSTWANANFGSRRQPEIEGHQTQVNPLSDVTTSYTPSSSYTTLPRKSFVAQPGDLSSGEPKSFQAHVAPEGYSVDRSQSNGYDPDEDIGEPPSYEASVASSGLSGSKHFQDGSYISTSSEMGGWDDSAIEVKGSGHQREGASSNTSDTGPSSRASSFVEDQDELLPYLQDAYEGTGELEGRGTDSEQRPESTIMPNVIPQLPPDTLRRPSRPPPDAMSVASAPPAARTMSEPSPPLVERPQLPPRGKTSPRFPGTVDLDRIDELDETTPHGYTLHHRGPYELQGSTATPPARMLEIRREEQIEPPPRVLVEDAQFTQPPLPVPFKLNLQPGGVLTRLPPIDNGRYPYAAPLQRAPLAPIVPSTMTQRAFSPNRTVYGNMRPELRNPGYGHEEPQDQYFDRTRMQYENQSYAPRRANSADPILQIQRAKSRNGFPTPTSANSSRSDFRAYPNVPVTSDFDYSSADERRRESMPGHLLLQQARTYDVQPRDFPPPQSLSQPVYSSSASVYSRASTSRTRVDAGPPRSVDLHRPKHLVMPAPLQQEIDRSLPNPYSPNFFPPVTQPSFVESIPAPKPSAATIRIHDPRKGNLLKKRLSKSVSPHEKHDHLAPVHMSESINNSVVSFGRGLEPEPELKTKKSSRKLSKRRHPI